MKIISTILFLGLTYYVSSQSGYSTILNLSENKNELATILHKSHDTILLRTRTSCLNNRCSGLVRFSVDKNKLLSYNTYDNVEFGSKNLIVSNNNILLSSEAAIDSFQHITVNIVDASSLEYLDSIQLSVPESRYFNYTIKSSIQFGGKYIFSGQALDSLNFVPLQGWNNFQENAILFIINEELNLDTTIIIEPINGAFLKIEDIQHFKDSILYISFYEKYKKTGSSGEYLENRKVIIGLDSLFNEVFRWNGPDFGYQSSFTNIAIGENKTIYANYANDLKHSIIAIDRGGNTLWSKELDSVPNINLYSMRRLLLAKNGDVVGAGIITSIVDKLGESGFIFRITQFGELKWKRAFRVNQGFDPTVPSEFPIQASLEDITEDEDGNLIAAGYVRNYNQLADAGFPYNFDAWILKLNSDGCIHLGCNYVQELVFKHDYLPIVSSQNQWVAEIEGWVGPSEINRYTFSQDSFLINGKYYHQQLFSPNMTGEWRATSDFFREDSARVYKLIDTMDGIEKLLYDFNFNPGDTLPQQNDGWENYRRVVSVSSITFSDDIIRKVISIECISAGFTDTTTWIEGMGDVEEFFDSENHCAQWDEGSTDLFCFSTNGELLYRREGIVDCFTSSTKDVEQEDLVTFPNPVSNEMYLQSEGNGHIEEILIYNSTGYLIYRSENPQVQDRIDISNCSPGFYHGIVFFTNSTIKKFKFVIVR